MADLLSPKARALIDRPVLAVVSTVAADGSPQATPVWIDREGDEIFFNTAEGRAKAVNITRDPRIAICVVDPDNPYNVVAVRGSVAELTTDGADDHIDSLAKKYLGVDSYPMRQPGEVRVKARVRPDRVVMQPAAD